MAPTRFGRTARTCGTVVLAAAALIGCGGSGSGQARSNSAATPTPAASTPAAALDTGAPTASPARTVTAAPRPIPSRRSHATPVPAGATRVPLGDDFRLQEGRSARVEGTDLVITFTRLVSDSRCPTNVTCIRQGEATIAIKVAGMTDPQSFQLSAPSGGGTGQLTDERRIGGYLFHLEAVEPWPMNPADGAVPDAQVVAVLRVSR